MLKKIDDILNKVTMYRLVVYELLVLLVLAAFFGAVGWLPYSPLLLALSIIVLFGLSWVINEALAWYFKAPANPESTWITALILALIISPPHALIDPSYVALAFWASLFAIGSKYLISIRGKHIFNPAAFGVAIVGTFAGLSASWWIGAPIMAPFALLGGLLLVRKIHRFDLWWSFIATFALGVTFLAFGGSGLQIFARSFLYAPAFFFSTVMLTEPLTTPPTRWLRVLYGVLVGILMFPNFNVFGFYLTPEVALLIGNLFAYLVSPKQKLVLTLRRTLQLSHDVYEFVFAPDQRFSFRPGQYLEWTLAHASPDSRSVRRYFTIASAPTDPEVRLGVKFYAPASSFKRALLSLRPGDTLVASQLAGDFTMPSDKKEKLVFIAGGIGITPFRSMIQYLVDKREARPITVLFANKTPDDVVYHELLEKARAELGINTIYSFSDPSIQLPDGCIRGITAETIARSIPDFTERTFYVSGPQGLVTSIMDTLLALGVSRRRIKTDYFPGFA